MVLAPPGEVPCTIEERGRASRGIARTRAVAPALNMRYFTALVLICAGLATGSAQPSNLLGTAYAYDAAHDVLPDWLWDDGLPDNARA